jgi:GWxTD domain-containing protein
MQRSLIIFICFVATTAAAQRFSRDNRQYFDYGSPCSAILYQNPEGTEVNILISTANMLFSFVRSDKQRQSLGTFYAIRDINIDIRDKASGVVTGGISKRDTLYAHDYESTISANVKHAFLASLPLDVKFSGELEVRCEIRDGMLSRMAYYPLTQVIRRFPFMPASTDSLSLGIGDLYVYDDDPSADRSILTITNIGGDYPFSQPISGIIPLTYPKGNTEPVVTLTLRQTGSFFESKLASPVEHTSLTIAPQNIQRSSIILPNMYRDSEVSLVVTDTTDSTLVHSLAFFTIPNIELPLGTYFFDITVTRGGISRKLSNEYKLVWKNMPISLTDIRTALPPLRYITTEEEYRYLSSGSAEDQFRKLFAYWQQRDPSPKTAMNELMAEFYSRVDYADHNFARNPRQLDGSSTDRGRVYLHYGKPTNISRTFLIGEPPTEIWTYDNSVKKVFIFTDESSNGNYRLIEERPL